MASPTEKLASIRRPLTLFVLEWDDIKPFAEIAATFIEARGAPLRMVSRRGSLQDAAEEAARLGSEWIAYRVTPVGPLRRPPAERLVINSARTQVVVASGCPRVAQFESSDTSVSASVKTLTIREAREGLSHPEQMFADDDEVLVVRRGEPVARILPPAPRRRVRSLAAFRESQPMQSVPSEVLTRADRDDRG